VYPGRVVEKNRHPVLIGVIIGVAGIVVWRKRQSIAALFRRVTMRGFGDNRPLVGLPTNADPSVCVRQIKRYTFAAMQDQSPIVGLTHASYALILMDTLEEMVGREAIKAAGYDPVAVRQLITQLQDQHAERLRACDPYIARVLELEKKVDGSGGAAALPGFVMNGGFGLGAPTGA